MRYKITVVGAGNVGATCAQLIAQADLADVAMVDVAAELATGKALDMMESAPVLGFNARITGGGDYDATTGSQVCVVTAGLARKPGMSRDDLLAKNTAIVYEAPGASACEVVAAILRDKKKILPCAVYLQGEYGHHNLFIGVPCKLGRGGMEGVVQLELSAEEQAQLAKSAAAVQSLVEVLPK